ncbi:hypothetical protein [Flavilitoribacter nigricans]|uniref:Uncharacterized protein n=1 Tax=Flavilitoribacter nigricans (strain ATCC 23147 / DSM 23189 / NBRC 102662 / NCIMB 1420 / SS-2) TaxID=1122177 RepID=A0A2D0N4B2_FLAN2|nr:hypothetical protein [Flavilitoribacter nigricans]PHN03240.1 hypothetical protein CRP01_28000 [Flavilitoribacter nigricans DSM 23189 = NBRC 102662]
MDTKRRPPPRNRPVIYTIFTAMRRLAIFLSVYIFTLAFAPVWSMLSLVTESVCCQEICNDEAGEHQDPHAGACSENCNPFQSCQCCLGFITADHSLEVLSFHTFLVRNDLFQSPVSTPVVSPIWHPPKI